MITRSPVWAFADAFRARYGGDMADSVLNLPELFSLDQYLQERGDEFNGRFDTASNLWEAAEKIGQVCRSGPIRQGNHIRMVRDQLQTVPDYVFTMDNVRNLKMDFVMHNERTADSVKVLYWDEDKDYEQQTVLCSLPGQQANNPEEVTLFGSTARQQSWREGRYLAATNKERRLPISFETEMEGFIPRYGSVVLLNHDLIGGGKMFSGEVIRETSLDGNLKELGLSRDVELTEGESWYIGFRDVEGFPVGPLRVEGISGNRVRLLDELPLGFTIETDPDMGRTGFAIGQGVNWCRRVKVTGIMPASDDYVTISGVIESDAVHTADQGEAPPPLPDYGLPGPSIGQVEGLNATQGGTVQKPILNLSWIPVVGADRYHVEFSTDGRSTWQPLSTPVFVPMASFPVDKGAVTVRVAAVGALRGEWAYLDLEAGSDFSTPAAVTLRLTEPFNGPSLKVNWDHEPAAARYLVEVRNSNGLLRSRYVDRPNNSFEYTYLHGQQDLSGRTITIRVRAENANGVQGEWASMTETNPAPAVPNNVSINGLNDGFSIFLDPGSESDIKELRVWASTEKGFTPGNNNRVATVVNSHASLSLKGVYYFRLAWVDLWGKLI